MEYDWGPGDPLLNAIINVLVAALIIGWAVMLFCFLVYL